MEDVTSEEGRERRVAQMLYRVRGRRVACRCAHTLAGSSLSDALANLSAVSNALPGTMCTVSALSSSVGTGGLTLPCTRVRCGGLRPCRRGLLSVGC